MMAAVPLAANSSCIYRLTDQISIRASAGLSLCICESIITGLSFKICLSLSQQPLPVRVGGADGVCSYGWMDESMIWVSG